MPDAYDALKEGRQVVFDTLTEETRSTTMTLLKPSATANEYEDVLELTSSWFYKDATLKTSALLEVARDDSEMTDAMAVATHVRIGDDIFVITQSDTLPPSGFAVTWKIFLERFTKRTQIKSLY